MYYLHTIEINGASLQVYRYDKMIMMLLFVFKRIYLLARSNLMHMLKQKTKKSTRNEPLAKQEPLSTLSYKYL